MNDPTYAPLFRKFAQGIVYRPFMMSITEIRTASRVTLFTRVHVDDIGILCGKSGKVIKALQWLFKKIGAENGDKVHISVEKYGEAKERPQRWHNAAWDKTEEALALASDVLLASGNVTTSIRVNESETETTLELIDAPIDMVEALHIALRAWGKSQGRDITVKAA